MIKLPILVWAPRYNILCGGGMVLHKLCHMLREKGEEAYIWIDTGDISSGGINQDYNTPIGNGIIDPKNAVIIYPEGVFGNPLGSKVVVRWILYKTNNTPDDNDIVMYYAPQYVDQPKLLDYLCILEINEKYFNTEEQKNIREGSCYTIRKGASKQRIPQTDSAQYIGRDTSYLGYVLPIFNSKEIFYSYDTETMLSLQAAMCGCLSVVIPDPSISAEEYRRKMPTHRYGVAYGTSEEELRYANRTKNLVKDYLLSINSEGERQIEVLLFKIDSLIKKGK